LRKELKDVAAVDGVSLIAYNVGNNVVFDIHWMNTR